MRIGEAKDTFILELDGNSEHVASVWRKINFATVLDVNKCPKQIDMPISRYMCTPFWVTINPSTLANPLRYCKSNYNTLLYVQEVVTPKKKYSIYLHQKIRFTPFINCIQYFRLNIIRLQSKIILGQMNSIG